MKPLNRSREQSPRPGRVQMGLRVGLSCPAGESRRPPKARSPGGPGGQEVAHVPGTLGHGSRDVPGGLGELDWESQHSTGCLSTCVPRQVKGATHLRLLPRPPSPSSLCSCLAAAVTWWLKTTGVCFFTVLEGTQGAWEESEVCVWGGGGHSVNNA